MYHWQDTDAYPRVQLVTLLSMTNYGVRLKTYICIALQNKDKNIPYTISRYLHKLFYFRTETLPEITSYENTNKNVIQSYMCNYVHNQLVLDYLLLK